MKILFSVFRYHTNMVPIVKSLRNRGHDVLIIAVAQEPYEDNPVNLVHLIDFESSVELQVLRVFDKFKPNIVVVRDQSNEFVAPLAAGISKYRNIKCISYEQSPCYAVSIFGAIYESIRHFHKQKKRNLPLLEISPKRGALCGFPIAFRRYFTYPILQDISDEPRSYFPSNIVRIVGVGKLGVERKRLHWLIEALESCKHDYQLLLVGANDLNRYPNRSVSYYRMLYERSRLGLAEGRIKILENVPFSQMYQLYRKTDIFVLPARGETFGISPLEAMSCGCAVLCANDNGSSSYLTHGLDSLIFESESYPDFVEKLFVLLNNKKLAVSLGSMAKKTIAEGHKFSDFERFFCAVVGEAN